MFQVDMQSSSPLDYHARLDIVGRWEKPIFFSITSLTPWHPTFTFRLVLCLFHQNYHISMLHLIFQPSNGFMLSRLSEFEPNQSLAATAQHRKEIRPYHIRPSTSPRKSVYQWAWAWGLNRTLHAHTLRPYVRHLAIVSARFSLLLAIQIYAKRQQAPHHLMWSHGFVFHSGQFACQSPIR